MVASEQIIQVLNYLGEKFGIAIDWTSDNVIPYLTELCSKLIAWEIWSSVAWLVFSIVGLVASIAYIKWFAKMIVDNEPEFLDIAMVTIGIIVAFASVIGIGTQIFDIIKCITFPEMHIFEYIQGLLNSGK